MSIETMTKIASATMGVGGGSSFDILNIPQTYTDLYLVYSTRATTTGSDMAARFNGDDTSNYRYVKLGGNGTTSSTDTASSQTSLTRVGRVNPSSATATVFSNNTMYIPNYTQGNNKAISVEGVSENGVTSANVDMIGGTWSSTAAVTSITLFIDGGGNFAESSSVTVYGSKPIRSAITKNGWASGGTVVTDGTYIYHTFTQTNVFNVNVGLKDVETLVIGGAGGGGSFGGGGGAGGLRYQLLSNLSVGPYTVIVGAGGYGGRSNGQGGSGTYSMFDTFKSSGGGGAGGYTTDGISGGSGGGGGTQGGVNRSGGSGNAGGYSPVEGYAGGNGYGGGSPYGAGGGGGATAAGATSSGASGAGGAGSSAYSAWGSATSTGQNISGTRWYAGGGGGASNSSYGAGGNGGGASGADSGNNGTANTGGGGGGANNNNPGGSGGSGLVIVRYKA